MELDVEAYASLMAELASAGDARAGVLARHGLDEASWHAIDSAWQARLSEAMGEEGDGFSPVLSAYAAAYQAAQRIFATPISLSQFAEVTRLLQSSGDLRASLARVGITIADYARGSEHWTRRIAMDPNLEREFEEALRG